MLKMNSPSLHPDLEGTNFIYLKNKRQNFFYFPL
jgi:hypothetical protein